MIVRYWQPFREVDALRRQIDGMFNELSESTSANKTTWTPAIRLIDRGDDYVLTVYLPGVTSKDIDIQVSREAVSISGERKPVDQEDHTLLYDDLRYGTFRRAVQLPEAVRNNSVDANLSDGVLTLTLPKVVEARNKVVKISLGQPEETFAAATASSTDATHATATATAETDDVWASHEG